MIDKIDFIKTIRKKYLFKKNGQIDNYTYERTDTQTDTHGHANGRTNEWTGGV